MEEALPERETDSPNSPLSSSSSDSDDEASENLQIETLEKSLAENSLDYDTHVQYIHCLRKYGRLAKLRQARESMNERFPLSSEMWQEWIKDEVSLCTSPEAFTKVENLYERAVQEYLSVPLWCDYINFVQEHDASISGCSPDGISKMRKLFERALTAVGLHIVEGNKMWELFREFEQAFCMTMSDADNEEKEKQSHRVRSLFHRQLSVPLVDLKTTLRDYKLWEAEQGNDNISDSEFDGVPKNVVSAYQKATELYNLRKQYEEEISNPDASDAEKLQKLMNYLKFEESSGDPARVQVLYERAVSLFPVSTDLWLGYSGYLDRILKVPTILRGVYSRATRNCAWVGELWVRYMLALERLHASEKGISDVFEQAIQSPLQSYEEYTDVFLTRVDGLRRRMSLVGRVEDKLDYPLIRETFQCATEYLSAEFLNTNDLLRLHSYWAKLEVKLGNDILAARGVWENLLKKSGFLLEVWQSYILMEVDLGQINEARSIYKRCYSRRFSGTGSEDICHSWLRFEREYGTLEDFDLAQKKVTPRLQELMAFRAQEEVKSDNATLIKQDSVVVNTPQKRKMNKAPEGKQPIEKKKKFTSEPAEASQGKQPTGKGNKSTYVPAEASERVSVRESEQFEDSREADTDQVNRSLDVDSTSKNTTVTSEMKDSKPDRYDDACTVFISNLSLEANEQHLREFFSDCGGITSVRFPRDRITGGSRGFAYVDFADDGHLTAAVAKNKQKLLGKKLSIARSEPKQKQKKTSVSSNSWTSRGGQSGRRLPQGNGNKQDGLDATVAPKRGGAAEFSKSVTFAAPRALVRPLGWTKRETKPDEEDGNQESEKPKSNDEFRNMLLKK